jgi:hypothetical protein
MLAAIKIYEVSSSLGMFRSHVVTLYLICFETNL